MRKHGRKWLGGCCILVGMRSILILFSIAALGFAIVLKKDAPPSAPDVAPTKRSEHVTKSSKHKWAPPHLNEERVIAHVAVNERER